MSSLHLATDQVARPRKRKTHSWGDPLRPNPYYTFRFCPRCPVIRVTRHEAANNPSHWTEYHRDGVTLSIDKVPKCEPVRDLVQLDDQEIRF